MNEINDYSRQRFADFLAACLRERGRQQAQAIDPIDARSVPISQPARPGTKGCDSQPCSL